MNDYVINAGYDKENLCPKESAKTAEQARIIADELKLFFPFVEIILSPVNEDGSNDKIIYRNF